MNIRKYFFKILKYTLEFLLLAIVCKVLIDFSLILFSTVIKFTSIHSTYKSNWNIDIPKTNNYKCSGGDLGSYKNICIISYDNKKANELKNKDFMKKIDYNDEKMQDDYDTIMYKFNKNLQINEKRLFDEEKLKVLLNENNYYTFIKKEHYGEFHYLFQILDVENNMLYIIEYT